MSELPESWLKTTLGQVVSYADNEPTDPADMPPEAWLLELEDIERDTGIVLEWKTVGERAPKSSKNRFQAGDVLYGKLRPYLNKVVRADQGGFCSSEIIAISPGLLNRNYLFYSMRSPSFIEYVSSVSHGMRMPRLGTQQAKSAPFVLPPLAEQTRIAAKLDELLAQVDTIKARIDGIPSLLKRFRQSVLAAAVSGRLTEGWRASSVPEDSTEYQSVDVLEPWSHTIEAPASWQMHIFEEVIKLVGGSQPPKSEFSYEPKPGFVRLIQIRDYKSDSHKVFINQESTKKFCSARDVMIGRYGPPIFQILRGLEGAYNVALMKAVPREGLNNEYMYWYLQNYKLLNFVEAGSDRTAGQSGVNKAFLEKYPLFIPPLDEQTEIVRRVEQLFAFADQLEAKVASAKNRIDRLTQSILAKAFRGELVPQDPNDEPASVLLERIKAQRAAAPKAKRGRKASA
ncbi:TPA: restriction endonuclease subunit S [Pseudomonas aeruginosa]|uniref:restriction endonuclease subunit S n=1 Tax=Pseudomonas aeruginosa TaxID=287 RepID=UPI0009A31C0F|nr:restriction endonuclease subunit S [Pseudomonas aeruginosa]MDI3611668.1 restriction endonuclease subunit S [Pseudomonas aeruginosa]MDI4012087.1 restriction endonuclease subunit S [Pseudomonas aeruginosa]MDI4025019.1 restriction endonuclease subunit S [Pseudomonas aeruginosa]HBO3498535.1 restriction endonuclease subunit S [Pseudomonas aeruginosa]HCF3688794.1 restriction endonuclease subunit S [Pseudomonas aeruginosa]